jgi:hypothetical protein
LMRGRTSWFIGLQVSLDPGSVNDITGARYPTLRANSQKKSS